MNVLIGAPEARWLLAPRFSVGEADTIDWFPESRRDAVRTFLLQESIVPEEWLFSN